MARAAKSSPTVSASFQVPPDGVTSRSLMASPRSPNHGTVRPMERSTSQSVSRPAGSRSRAPSRIGIAAKGVTLSDGKTEASALHDAIGNRHSNRGPYTTTGVAADVLAMLAANADGPDGVGVHWFATPSERTALGALIIDATQAIIDDEEQSKDAFAWFRNDREWAEAVCFVSFATERR